MRALFTFAGGAGHAEPLVPIARAVAAAGHAVAFSGRMSVVAEMESRGFAVFPDPPDPADAPQGITPLAELSTEREDAVLRHGFADRIARARAARVLALCGAEGAPSASGLPPGWGPDVVVCDEVDFGAMVAAERAGVPHATVIVVAAGGLIRAAVVADALDAVRAGHGLEPDPELRMSSRHLVLSPGPPSFRDPAFPLPATAVSIRPPEIDPVGGPRRPAVYFTLGTVFNVESGDLFGRVLAGLRELPVEVVATVGRQVDPRRLGPQPANVRVAAHIPLAEVLARCDAVVSHGGSGTVTGALAAGLPSVLLPMGADQPLNAARCEALGAGIALDALRATPAAIGEAVTTVLEDPRYRRAAARLREESAALPPPAHAVELLERLVTAGA